MNPKRKKRLILVLFLVFGVGVAVSLALYALNQNINLFYSPQQMAKGEAPENTRIRAGGMVVEGSVVRDQQSLHVQFDITDYAESVTVEYTGILPDLFREGQGIVAQGSMDASGVFQAVEVLAKHDENYMPPEVAYALEKAGKMPVTPKEAFNK
ncbi:cytochrome c maturation protein CcmE [Neptunomonas antarctica]|uniref:Cytochrome c-type biogenesis protein CcmE n=1 Tax=Neptunomonas antarctica TaxID=619304 RepID=A0A1N7JCV2_9GAMM|nr:cytochrome c maturation protein CcmE [Neptunomonas antarctica]SIS47149.1 cytochrome c-type biogenesis protein CcmE [Neptunomonas antarctica]